MTKRPDPPGDTPLERRMRRAGDWPQQRENPTCKRCQGAGWFVTMRGDLTYSWRCACAAGDAAPKGLPRWREPAKREPMPEAPKARRDAAAGPDEGKG
jgi:hypothetical protein